MKHEHQPPVTGCIVVCSKCGDPFETPKDRPDNLCLDCRGTASRGVPGRLRNRAAQSDIQYHGDNNAQEW